MFIILVNLRMIVTMNIQKNMNPKPNNLKRKVLKVLFEIMLSKTPHEESHIIKTNML